MWIQVFSERGESPVFRIGDQIGFYRIFVNVMKRIDRLNGGLVLNRFGFCFLLKEISTDSVFRVEGFCIGALHQSNPFTEIGNCENSSFNQFRRMLTGMDKQMVMIGHERITQYIAMRLDIEDYFAQKEIIIAIGMKQSLFLVATIINVV